MAKEIKKKTKARNGEGSLRQRKDGRWELQYSISGKKGSLYGSTREEVNKKFVMLKHQLMTGAITQLEKIRYSDWFEIWITNYKSIKLKPKTLQSYVELYDLYIGNSNIAGLYLQDITVQHIQYLINNLIKKELSARTIKYVITIIRGSLKQAVMSGYIQKNPADAVTTPREDKKEPRVLTIEEQQAFMNALSGNRYEFLFYFALKTGLRTGEILGLQWKNIDFEKRTFSVKRTMVTVKDKKTKKLIHTYGKPKTKKSIRTIPLTDDLTNKLLKHQEIQKKEMEKADIFWLGMNKTHYADNNVFLTEKGTPVYPSTLRHLIIRTIKRINQERLSDQVLPEDTIPMEHFSMHALRHTFATRALEHNIPPRVVQEILGHSSITITLDTYSHVIPSTLLNYMNQIDNEF